MSEDTFREFCRAAGISGPALLIVPFMDEIAARAIAKERLTGYTGRIVVLKPPPIPAAKVTVEYI